MSVIFGIRLAPLFHALAVVESERGATSSNVYQIRDVYLKDVNRIMEHPNRRFCASFRLCDRLNRARSEDAMIVYWLFWGERYERDTGNRVTPEVLARIHNGGPFGYKKSSTYPYWQKVLTVMLSTPADVADAWMANRTAQNYHAMILGRKGGNPAAASLVEQSHNRLLGATNKGNNQ